jgi:hypothetical protein
VRLGVPLLLSSLACASAQVRQAPDLELEIVRRALEDELRDATRDSLVLFHQLIAPIEPAQRASDFQAWLDAMIPESFRRGIPLDLLQRYWEVNKTTRSLPPVEAIAGRSVRLIRERAPTDTAGFFAVSRVGLARSSDSAVVSVSFACPGLCGSTDMWLYVRSSAGWERRRRLHSLVY